MLRLLKKDLEALNIEVVAIVDIYYNILRLKIYDIVIYQQYDRLCIFFENEKKIFYKQKYIKAVAYIKILHDKFYKND